MPSLGADTFAPSSRHALLHALFHRIWNLGLRLGESLIWLVDIDLLARRFRRSDWERFAQLVADCDLGPICRDGLEKSREILETPMPKGLLEAIAPVSNRPYPQMTLKHPGWRRHWFEMRALASWALRMRYLREHLLPDRAYMETVAGSSSSASLTIAYLRRLGEKIRRHLI